MFRTMAAMGAAAFFFVVPICLGAGAEPLVIGTITVNTLDVFSPDEVSNSAFRVANALHIETHEGVIRGRLLFHEGDSYDPALLAQSERNLRALSFIKSASVTAGEPHDGVVDVSVVTQDAWTLQPEFSIGSKGGSTDYSIALSDSNILGFGRDISIVYDNGSERTRTLLAYSDPAFIRPYWSAKLLLSNNSDGSERAMSIGRPFYAFSTRWTTQAGADDLTQESKIYESGEVSSRFQLQHKQLFASYGVSLTRSDSFARRLWAGIDFSDDFFFALESRPGDTIPDDRQFRYGFVRYQDVASDFVKMNFINKDIRYEDINLGRDFSLELALSPPAAAVDATTGRIRTSFARGLRVGENGFVLSRVAYQTRVSSSERQNEILSGELRFVRRFASERPQVFLARVLADRGWNLDRDVQFFADGSTGLRGYRLWSFEGDKRLILNLEQRVYLGREIFRLVSPSIAGFIDSGTATPPGGAIRIGALNTDAGIGFRFGSTRTPNNVFRLDLAYAFDPDPFGRRGFLVSFSSAQAF